MKRAGERLHRHLKQQQDDGRAKTADGLDGLDQGRAAGLGPGGQFACQAFLCHRAQGQQARSADSAHAQLAPGAGQATRIMPNLAGACATSQSSANLKRACLSKQASSQHLDSCASSDSGQGTTSTGSLVAAASSCPLSCQLVAGATSQPWHQSLASSHHHQRQCSFASASISSSTCSTSANTVSSSTNISSTSSVSSSSSSSCCSSAAGSNNRHQSSGNNNKNNNRPYDSVAGRSPSHAHLAVIPPISAGPASHATGEPQQQRQQIMCQPASAGSSGRLLASPNAYRRTSWLMSPAGSGGGGARAGPLAGLAATSQEEASEELEEYEDRAETHRSTPFSLGSTLDGSSQQDDDLERPAPATPRPGAPSLPDGWRAAPPGAPTGAIGCARPPGHHQRHQNNHGPSNDFRMAIRALGAGQLSGAPGAQVAGAGRPGSSSGAASPSERSSDLAPTGCRADAAELLSTNDDGPGSALDAPARDSSGSCPTPGAGRAPSNERPARRGHAPGHRARRWRPDRRELGRRHASETMLAAGGAAQPSNKTDGRAGTDSDGVLARAHQVGGRPGARARELLVGGAIRAVEFFPAAELQPLGRRAPAAGAGRLLICSDVNENEHRQLARSGLLKRFAGRRGHQRQLECILNLVIGRRAGHNDNNNNYDDCQPGAPSSSSDLSGGSGGSDTSDSSDWSGASEGARALLVVAAPERQARHRLNEWARQPDTEWLLDDELETSRFSPDSSPATSSSATSDSSDDEHPRASTISDSCLAAGRAHDAPDQQARPRRRHRRAARLEAGARRRACFWRLVASGSDSASGSDAELGAEPAEDNGDAHLAHGPAAGAGGQPAGCCPLVTLIQAADEDPSNRPRLLLADGALLASPRQQQAPAPSPINNNGALVRLNSIDEEEACPGATLRRPSSVASGLSSAGSPEPEAEFKMLAAQENGAENNNNNNSGSDHNDAHERRRASSSSSSTSSSSRRAQIRARAGQAEEAADKAGQPHQAQVGAANDDDDDYFYDDELAFGRGRLGAHTADRTQPSNRQPAADEAAPAQRLVAHLAGAPAARPLLVWAPSARRVSCPVGQLGSFSSWRQLWPALPPGWPLCANCLADARAPPQEAGPVRHQRQATSPGPLTGQAGERKSSRASLACSDYFSSFDQAEPAPASVQQQTMGSQQQAGGPNWASLVSVAQQQQQPQPQQQLGDVWRDLAAFEAAKRLTTQLGARERSRAGCCAHAAQARRRGLGQAVSSSSGCSSSSAASSASSSSSAARAAQAAPAQGPPLELRRQSTITGFDHHRYTAPRSPSLCLPHQAAHQQHQHQAGRRLLAGAHCPPCASTGRLLLSPTHSTGGSSSPSPTSWHQGPAGAPHQHYCGQPAQSQPVGARAQFAPANCAARSQQFGRNRLESLESDRGSSPSWTASTSSLRSSIGGTGSVYSVNHLASIMAAQGHQGAAKPVAGGSLALASCANCPLDRGQAARPDAGAQKCPNGAANLLQQLREEALGAKLLGPSALGQAAPAACAMPQVLPPVAGPLSGVGPAGGRARDTQGARAADAARPQEQAVYFFFCCCNRAGRRPQSPGGAADADPNQLAMSRTQAAGHLDQAPTRRVSLVARPAIVGAELVPGAPRARQQQQEVAPAPAGLADRRHAATGGADNDNQGALGAADKGPAPPTGEEPTEAGQVPRGNGDPTAGTGYTDSARKVSRAWCWNASRAPRAAH